MMIYVGFEYEVIWYCWEGGGSGELENKEIGFGWRLENT